MLVLTRKRGEKIMVGDDIVIVICELHGDKCRIGIQAPKGVQVHREEVFEAIKLEGPKR